MNDFSRLVRQVSSIGLLCGSAALISIPCAAQLIQIVPDSPPLLLHTSQGYLGVETRDIDNDRATALKLKDAGGAEVTYVDHDAPAGKIGLRIHDVILQMNGQQVQSVEQFRRMLLETPAGRSVALVISRDGQQLTIHVQLADRATVEQNAWSRHQVVPEPNDDFDFSLSTPPSHGSGGGNSFFGAIVLGTPSVGVEVDTLGTQLADYFGVKDGQGLLVKHVAENSPGSTAGFKAGDVITKVNGEAVPTLNTWFKTLHANRGKQMQVTIVRNHKEQILSLQPGDPKHKGELVWPNTDLGPNVHIFAPGDDGPVLRPEIERNLAQLNSQLDPSLLADQVMSEIDADKVAEQACQAAGILDDRQLQQELRKIEKNLQSMRILADHPDTY